jgi:hypothetical protein
VNQEGQLTGASSAVKAFQNGGMSTWVFHQLCAMTNPYLLEQSGQLYTWRAEYLASRPESLKICGWFDGNSRWLERIYVKFILGKSSESWLKAVKIVRLPLAGRKRESDAFIVTIGELERVLVDTPLCYGGANPKFLNASGILDCIVALNDTVKASQIVEVGESLNALADRGEGVIEVTLNTSSELQFENAELVTDCNRMFLFSKEDLYDFVSSVEHSLAVTLKKVSLL